MGKYTIETDGITADSIQGYLGFPIEICGKRTWVKTDMKLTPYTEPDTESIRKEAYQQGHKDGYNKHDTEKIRKQGYDKGLDDIGNALRLLLFQYSNYTLQDLFGYDTARAVVEHYEGSEIVARIRCYEGGVRQDAETIRKEAYDKAFEDAEQVAESGKRAMYQKGLSDAWNTARKIGSNSMCSLEEMGFDFGQCVFNDYNPSWYVVKNYSASECIERLQAYEQEKEEEIQVGDEVVGTYTGEEETEPFVIIRKIPEIYPNYYFGIYSKSGEFCQGGLKLKKTGRHFPEIAEVLEKMRGE